MSTPHSLSGQEPAAAAGRIDWNEVRLRLQRVGTGLAAPSRDAAALDELLQRRARELAQPLSRPAAVPDAGTECVVFQVEGQAFALEVRGVREVVAVARLTPLPGLPATFRGLANLRGQILPVFSLRTLFRLPGDAVAREREEVLVVEWDGAVFGVAIDTLRGAMALPLAQLRAGVPGLQEQFLRGLTPDGIAVLDLAALGAAFTIDEPHA